MSEFLNYKLGELSDVKLSNVDKKTKDGEITVRLCNYTDVYKNSFINSHKAAYFMVASCNDNEFEKFLLKKGQVAITKDSEKRNDIGISTYISESFDDVVLGYHLALIEPYADKLDGRYLNYWFNTNQAKVYFENNTGGSGQRFTLPLEIIKGVPLKLPSLKSQQKIAAVLSALDDKIELNNKMNAELEALAKSIYDYWFVQFDFPNSPPSEGCPQDGVVSNFTGTSINSVTGNEDISKVAESQATYSKIASLPLAMTGYKSSGGKMVYNETLKREIPEGWEVKTVGDFFQIKKGTLITEKTANALGKVKVVSAGLSFSYYHDTSNFSENTITVSASGANAGFVNFWREPIFACDCTTIKGSNLEETLYGFEFLKDMQEHIYNQARGSAQPHVYPKDIAILSIAIPPKHLLDNYGKIVNPINLKISNNIKQNQQLAELRDWLLPMLMNGQVKVE